MKQNGYISKFLFCSAELLVAMQSREVTEYENVRQAHWRWQNDLKQVNLLQWAFIYYFLFSSLLSSIYILYTLAFQYRRAFVLLLPLVLTAHSMPITTWRFSQSIFVSCICIWIDESGNLGIKYTAAYFTSHGLQTFRFSFIWTSSGIIEYWKTNLVLHFSQDSNSSNCTIIC
jgi:hypothetical protein